MKRITVFLLVLLLLCSMVACSFADGGAGWTCTCGRENSDYANFCGSCGLPRANSAQVNYCTNCGQPLAVGDDFCIYCGTSRAAASGWPVFTPYPVQVTLRPTSNEDRRYSRGGPERGYMETGGYKPYKVLSTKAWFIEDGYVLTEVKYKTAGTRIVYFPKSNLLNDGGDLMQMQLTGIRAVLIAETKPYFGPGTYYDSYKDTAVRLLGGTEVKGFFVVDGYVFCEFMSLEGKLTRGWIPESRLRIL